MPKLQPPTVRQVETAARDMHPAFDETRTPAKVLRRHLQLTARALVHRAVAIFPDPLLTCQFEYDLPPADFGDGERLPKPVLYARGGKVTWSDGTEDELHLVSRAVLAEPPAWPAAAIVGGVMYLARTAQLWDRGQTATVLYVPEMAPLTEPDDDFDPLPFYAENALVAAAALFLARRAELTDLRDWRDDAHVASREFLVTLSNQRRATRGKRRKVF